MPRGSLCALLFGLSLGVAADAGNWKVAPSPPVSRERDRVADLSNRRRAVMDRIGAQAILMLYAAEPRNYAGDVDWPYRQENEFFYLTGISQPGGTLLLLPGASAIREILFLPPPNPARESWTGHLITAPEAREISGIHEVWDAGLLNSFLRMLIPRAREVLPAQEDGKEATARSEEWKKEFEAPLRYIAKQEAQWYMLLPARPDPVEYGREREFASRLGSVGPGLAIQDATPVLTALRRVKSPREIDLLQHAIDISAEGFQRAYTLALPGAWEYEIQAQFELTFSRRGGHWGYPCIVGAGKNATTLHYETNKDRIAEGDLVLMDDGAEFDGYSADVTRTIPANGRYTREQAEIYRLVWEAQQAGIQRVRPGHAMSGPGESVNGAISEVFRRGLLKLGLITDAASDAQLRIWYNHGAGHGIGLNVHDPGGPELEPGMVITVEPGLYIRPDALENLPKNEENEKFIAAVRPAFQKYRGIGIRVEDDVLVTAAGPKVLSSGIPSKLEEVEETIARLRKAMRNSPLP